MDGVQFVLHNPIFETTYTWGWSWVGLILILLSISFIALSCLLAVYKSSLVINSIIMAIAFGILALIAFSDGTEIETYQYSEYEVILHEGVDYKEFLEKYEILEVNGDFYTIKERDNK